MGAGCPHTASTVIETRGGNPGGRRRRRVCKTCRSNFTTYEVNAERLELFEAQEAVISALRQLLKAKP